MLPDPAYELLLLEEVDRREQEWVRLQRSTPQSVADRAAAIARRNPNLPGSIVGPAAQITDLPVDHPLLDATAKIVVADEARSVWGHITAGIKGAVRTAFTVFEGLERSFLDNPMRQTWARDEDIKNQQRQAAVAAGVDPALLDMPRWKLTPEQQQAVAGLNIELDFGAADRKAQEVRVPTVMERAWDELRAGRPVNLGTGFFPESVDPRLRQEYVDALGQGVDPATAQAQVEAQYGRDITTPERTEREAFSMSVPGRTGTQELRNPTIGRVMAARVLDQDADAFGVVSGLVDAVKVLAGDPTLIGGKVVKSARLSKRLLLPSGTRSGIWRQNVDEFLNSTRGQQVVDALAETTDINDLRRMAGTDNKNILRDLHDATDANAVREVLRPVLGTELRLRPTDLKFRHKALGDGAVARMLTDRPDQVLDLEDISGTIQNFDNFMVTARLTKAQRSGYLNRLIRVNDGDRKAVMQIVRDMNDEVGRNLGRVRNMNEEIVKQVTRIMDDQFTDIETFRNYFVSEAGRPVMFPGIHLHDEIVDAFKATPHLFDEFLQRAIILPDARQMRRAYSNIRGWVDMLPDPVRALVFTSTSDTAKLRADTVTLLMDAFTTNIWKPMVLLRPAWMVRVGLEEQARMAGAGLDSMFSHPARWLAWMTGVGSDGMAAVAKDPQPWRLMDEFDSAMTKRYGGWIDEVLGDEVRRGRHAKVQGTAYAVARPTDGRFFYHGWAENLRRLSNDPIAPHIAAHGPDATKVWLRTDKGQRVLKGQVFRTRDRARRTLLNDDAALNAYIDSTWARINQQAGGNFEVWYDGALYSESKLAELYRAGNLQWAKMEYRITKAGDRKLLDAISDGKLGNQLLRDRLGPVDLRKIQGSLEKWDEAFRPVVTTSSLKAVERTKGQTLADVYDGAVNFFFRGLGAAPTNKLARSPAFKQFYWDRLQEMIPYMDEATARNFIKAAEVTRVPTNVLAQLETAAQKALRNPPTGKLLGMKQADQIAKAHALASTKHLLYDLNRKKNFFDITRNIFPFGEAHFEVLSRWAKLMVENPAVLRGGQLAIQAGRNSGFVWTNDDGEEMYGIPAEGPIAQLFGWDSQGEVVRNRTGGRLSALNIAAGGVIPGFGPFVQWPVSDFLRANEADSEWNWLRDLVIPYGDVSPDTPGDVINIGLPGWAQKVVTGISGDGVSAGGNQQRLFNNTVSDVLNAGLVAGRYDITTPEGLRAAEEDAVKVARRIWWLRAVWQFAGPSSAQVYHEAEDPDGRWWAFHTLSREANRLMRKHDGDDVAATGEFIQRFGVDPYGFATAKSQPIYKRGTSSAARDFELAHPDEFKDYPATAYYAGPDEKDEFDYRVYLDHLSSGVRVPRNSEQWLAARNDLLGSVAYQKKKDEVGDDPSPADRAYLREYRAWLRLQYPGFEAQAGKVAAASWQEKMDEFTRWERNPKLAGTEQGQGVVMYMKARRGVFDELNTTTFATLAADKSAPYRAYLRDYAAWLIRRYPAFESVYSDVMARELEEDN